MKRAWTWACPTTAPKVSACFRRASSRSTTRWSTSDNFVVLDGTIPVNKLQKQMRDIVASKIDLKRFAPRIQEAE